MPILAGIFGSIVSGIFGGGLKTVTDAITDIQKRKIDMQTNEQKLEADMEIAALTAKRDVLLAENGAGGIRSWIRPLLAMPWVAYLWKVVVWDKVVCSFADLGGCRTDALGPDLFNIMMIVITAYFIDRTIKSVLRR